MVFQTKTTTLTTTAYHMPILPLTVTDSDAPINNYTYAALNHHLGVNLTPEQTGRQPITL